MVFRWFLIFLPSVSMVFDGSGPLVERCDGFEGSLWSSDQVCNKCKHHHCTMWLSIAFELSKDFLKAWYLPNFDLILKIPFMAGQKLSKDSGENIPFKNLSKILYWLAKKLVELICETWKFCTHAIYCMLKKTHQNKFFTGALIIEKMEFEKLTNAK